MMGRYTHGIGGCVLCPIMNSSLELNVASPSVFGPGHPALMSSLTPSEKSRNDGIMAASARVVLKGRLIRVLKLLATRLASGRDMQLDVPVVALLGAREPKAVVRVATVRRARGVCVKGRMVGRVGLGRVGELKWGVEAEADMMECIDGRSTERESS